MPINEEVYRIKVIRYNNPEFTTYYYTETWTEAQNLKDALLKCSAVTDVIIEDNWEE